MRSAEIFESYALETRRLSQPGMLVESLPHFLRCTPERTDADAMITFANLPLGSEDELIDSQLAHFAKLGRAFEWKVYSLDQPSDIYERLVQRGFTAGPVELFMVLPLQQDIAIAERDCGAEIRPILDEGGVGDMVSIQEDLYKRSFGWWGAELLQALREAPDTISLYGAYVDGKAVGGGRATFPKDGRFAGLFGGSVLPKYRERGIYSALLRRRVQEARERGHEFVIVDAAPMSRPILERKGFIRVCETWPMRHSFVL